MNIHEYQAKAILREFGVPVPDGHVCYNGASAREWAKRLGEGPWVVKAQIHAGGRGKGGGVKLARTSDEVRNIAREMLGMVLRTHQTGPEGKVVTRVLVENGCNIERELYVSLLVDRTTSKVTVMASTEGGMDIEEVAAKTPEKIFKETIDPLVGLTPFQCRNHENGYHGEYGKRLEGARLFVGGGYYPPDRCNRDTCQHRKGNKVKGKEQQMVNGQR